VMYGGRVVEEAPAEALFDGALHPYSVGLLSSTPTIDTPQTRRLPAIGGAVPHITDMPDGCAFHPRCPKRFAPCDSAVPQLESLSSNRRVACWARQDDTSGRLAHRDPIGSEQT
jgi:oligopeptide/dipeptide ABC transporter ATP-binding protein